MASVTATAVVQAKPLSLGAGEDQWLLDYCQTFQCSLRPNLLRKKTIVAMLGEDNRIVHQRIGQGEEA